MGKELVLCSKCNGGGFNLEYLINANTKHYEPKKHNCNYCLGSGRRWKTTTVTFEPFVNEKEV